MILDTVSLLTAVVTGILSLIVYKVISFYKTVAKYPRGPFPLPVVGNIPFLIRIKKNRHMHDVLEELSKVYGPVFTIWLGYQPQILVYDTEACLEVLKSKTFAGRPHFAFSDEVASRPGSINIAFGDFSREWEVLRRVSFAAIRKYATNESLSHHVVHVTDQIVDRMNKKPSDIDVEENMSILLLALLSTSAFGKKYDLEDEEFKEIVKTMELLSSENQVFFVIGLASSLRFVFWFQWQKILKTTRYFRNLVGQRYQEHEESFDISKNRDFTDSLLWARSQAEEDEEPEVLKYIDQWNIRNAVANLFFAGSQTSRMTLLWWFLHSALDQVICVISVDHFI